MSLPFSSIVFASVVVQTTAMGKLVRKEPESGTRHIT